MALTYVYGESVDEDSPTFARLTGDARILAQWIANCLDTPFGALWSAPTYGLGKGGLRGYLLAGLTEDDLARIPAEVRNATKYDERISDADVTAERTYTGGGAVALKLTILVTPKGAESAPFTMTGTITEEQTALRLKGL